MSQRSHLCLILIFHGRIAIGLLLLLPPGHHAAAVLVSRAYDLHDDTWLHQGFKSGRTC